MKKLSIVILIAAVVVSSCSKTFFDINQNPNSSTNASVDLVLANALKVSAGFQNTAYSFLSEWMCHWAPSGSYAISSSDGSSYKQTTGFGDGLWTAYYRNLEDYDYVEKTAIASNQYFYIAAAKTMKALLYSQLVDMFNNIPYSQALQGTNNLTPTYDGAQAVYEDLSTQLGAAVVLFQRADAVGSLTQDILFGVGYPSARVPAANQTNQNANWAKFANSLRLRLLLRQTNMSGRAGYIQTEVNKIVANGAGFLTVNAGVNPGYSNSSGKQNPFYGFCYNTAGTFTQDFWRAAKYPIDFCKANNDNRLGRLYALAALPVPPGGFDYVGCVQGLSGNPVGSQSSTFGAGSLVSVSQDAVIFSAAESYLNQAEAILRGYLAGSAQTMFNNGVQASFTFLGAGSSAAYTSQAGNNQTNYAACASDAERVACIIRQKWMANNSVTPFEAWADYRRTGLPNVPLSSSSFVDVLAIPTRILYPTSEYTTNGANVGAQGTINHHGSKIFWMP